MKKQQKYSASAAILMALMANAEITPIVCHECGHIDEPHALEQVGSANGFNLRTTISGAISSTATFGGSLDVEDVT